MGRIEKRKSIFINKKTKIDDVIFDSKAEANRYIHLKYLQRIGDIEKLVLQPKFRFEVNGKPLKCIKKGSRQITYTADFQYEEDGVTVVEDVKSPLTAGQRKFKIIKALFETIYEQELKVVL